MEDVIRQVGAGSIRLIRGDITDQVVDVIANAANSGLRGGGGVDGAIHRAAGPELLAACRALGGCPTGSAVLTPAFRLKARFVAHAVGPVWLGGLFGAADKLAGAYRRCLELSEEQGCVSIAFPSISTGIYGYPVARAAPVALAEMVRHLATARTLTDLRVVLFDDASFAAWQRALEAL